MSKAADTKGHENTSAQIGGPLGSEPESTTEEEKKALLDRMRALRGHAGNGLSTDEIVSMTRGDR